MGDHAALFAAVLADPGDDTLRLAWADYLDGLDPVRVPCPKCGGTGSHGLDPYALAQRYGTHRAGLMLDASRCGICDGTGSVLDTSNADRAELVRVQVELTKCHPTCGVGKVCRGVSAAFGVATCAGVRDRERQLRAANPGWSACPCPACGGCGRTRHQILPPPVFRSPTGRSPSIRDIPPVVERECETCGGTGDLLRYFPPPDVPYMGVPFSRVLSWHAGYPASLACRLDEVCRDRCDECGGYDGVHSRGGCRGELEWRPSPWARALVAAVPVTALVPAGLEPEHDNGGWYGWDFAVPGGRVRPQDLPVELWRALEPRGDGDTHGWYPTRELAAAALGRACARFARGTIHRFPADPSGPASTPAGNL